VSSWFSPKTEKRTSPIEGRGLFARHAITAGEVVAVKGGAIMDATAFARVRDQVSPAEIQIEDDLYIAPRSAEEVEANILCLNHSCRPNAEAYFVKHVIKIRAIRNIKPGDEITYHYGRNYFTAFIKDIGCKCAACAAKTAKIRQRRSTSR